MARILDSSWWIGMGGARPLQSTFVRSKGGFTVIELLVVLAIVGVMLALTMPLLRSGAAAAQTVKCTGNLKQIYTAAQMWSADNNGVIVPMGKDGNDAPSTSLESIAGVLAPYLGRASNQDFKTVQDLPVFVCPARPVTFGYGYNFNYLNWFGNAGNWKTMAGLSSRLPLSKMVFMCDSEMSIPVDDFTNGNSWRSWIRPPSGDGYIRPGFRHPGKTANVLWMDGHISQERVTDPWMDPLDQYWGNYDRQLW